MKAAVFPHIVRRDIMKSPSHPTHVSPGTDGNLLPFPEETLNSSDTLLESADSPSPSQPTSEATVLPLARVVAAWQPLVRHLGRRRRVLESILSAGRPLWLSGKTLVVGFAADRQFHRELLDVPEYRKIVEAELARRFGVELAVVTKLYPESRQRSTFGRPPA
jgi:hypothetical protein